VVKEGHAPPLSDCTKICAVHSANIAAYVLKVAAALGTSENGHAEHTGGHRTPFQVLAAFVASGEERDMRVWREWEDGMRGARQLTWSHGVKARYGMADMGDQAVVAAASEQGEVVAMITAPEWRTIMALGPSMRLRLLEAAEHGGGRAVDALLSNLPAP
jgi:hypothetical protein